jgi:branched-chain amino acid transport system ATP-binding protein
MTLLRVEDLYVAHGDLPAVRGVSLTVEENETFVLLGANGAGKTSLLRSISGLTAPKSGNISFGGACLLGRKPHEVAAAGVAHVPEGRRIFPNLTVEENLTVSFIKARAKIPDGKTPGGKAPLAAARGDVYGLFPRLAGRRRQTAGTLSGGEQQMLAIGRALMNFPRLLMLDEPSVGLSPAVCEEVFERLDAIRRRGVSLLLVEQNASSLDLAARGLVLENGAAVLAGDQAALKASDFVRRAYPGA